MRACPAATKSRSVLECGSPLPLSLSLVALLLAFLLTFGVAPESRAFLAADADTMASAYMNAFYAVNGSSAYFRDSQTNANDAYFWGQANEIESVIDAYEWTSNSTYKVMITNLLNGFQNNNGTSWSWNIYNDDVMWACMAFARGYQRTGNTTFRDIAKANFDMCYARGWDTNLGGGLYWTTDKRSKNACVNGPGAIAAALLYQIYGDAGYWSKATNLYYWERAVLFNPTTGRIYDNINTNGNVDQTPITYNQGTFIGAADLLGQTNDAMLAANYTMLSMCSDGYLPRYGIANNNSIFNAIFIRWTAKYMQNRGLQSTYQLWLQNQANAAWNGQRAADNLSWCQWPYPTPNGISLYSCDCLPSFEAMLAVPPTQSPNPTVVTLKVSDASQTSSFESGLKWSDGATPSALHDYVVSGLSLRTPQDSLSHYFGGSSLTLSNGAVLACKNTSGGKGISVGTELFLDNGEVANWSGNSTVFAGKVTLRADGGRLDPQGTTFTIAAGLGGPGSLRIKAADSSHVGGKVILAGNNTYTGGTIIDAAHTVQLSGLGTLGDAGGALTFSNSAGLGFGTLDLNGVDLDVGNLSGAGGRILNNATGATDTLSIGNGNATGGSFQGVITNGAGMLNLVKVGSGTLTLAGANPYTGPTLVSGGVLALAGSGSLSGSSRITVVSGATLNVFSRVDQTLNLVNGQTLSGSGTVVGKLNSAAGSTVAPGDGIGTLTIQDNITLAGVLLMELNRTNAQRSDRLVSSLGTITATGTLVVTNVGPALQPGDSFQLFEKPVTGFAAVSLPDVSPFIWSNNLAVDGTISLGWSPAAVSVSSPDGNVVATVDTPGSNLVYAVYYRGILVVEPSPLGLTLNGLNLGSGVSIASASSYATNESFPSRHGIHGLATNQYQGQLFTVNQASSGISYGLNFRVYPNGVAFRYELAGTGTKNIPAEASSFVLPAGSTVWSQSNTSDYQGVYTGTNIEAMAANAVMGPPVTIQLPGTNGFMALTESTLGVFGSPYLKKPATATGRQLQVSYPANQDGTTGVSIAGAVNTPWNVIMAGADLNQLVNNDIVESLAPAPDPALFPQGADTAWAASGRSVWDWLNPQPGGITWTNAMTNSLWASRLGLEYNTIDEGWASWNSGNPWPQVQQVVSYSHALGVKVLLWKTSSELSTSSQRTTFFQQLRTYGVDGFKADFFDFNSVNASARERVKLEEDILREAAGYHLAANFHGSTKPTGQFRTYPNLLQVEAVFGKEQYLSSLATVPVPFTRLLAGPADFTPMDLGTQNAYEIANPICLPGPIITFAERSDTIAASPYAALIRTIPSQWDETIVLSQSTLGRTAALARRKGQDWYIGIMNTAVTQSWNLPLTFLAPNTNYQAYLLRETSTTLERTNVSRENVLAVTITNRGGSGFVARFFHEPPFTLSTNALLTGNIIGTSGSWAGSANTKDKALDGSLTTYFDAAAASGAWVGLDLGSGRQTNVVAIRYCPRPNWASRMTGGLFQGANAADFSDATTLATVGYTPPEGAFTTVMLTNTTAFRYLRYLSPANGWCNVAELQFYGPALPPPPSPTVISQWSGTNLTLNWPGGGRVLEATNLAGPWTTNLGATSPFTVIPADPQKFYRILVQ